MDKLIKYCSCYVLVEVYAKCKQCPCLFNLGNAPALPPRTPEQQARAMAALQRMLRERLQQDGARNDAAGK
jgi:hypothetical protein